MTHRAQMLLGIWMLAMSWRQAVQSRTGAAASSSHESDREVAAESAGQLQLAQVDLVAAAEPQSEQQPSKKRGRGRPPGIYGNSDFRQMMRGMLAQGAAEPPIAIADDDQPVDLPAESALESVVLHGSVLQTHSCNAEMFLR